MIHVSNLCDNPAADAKLEKMLAEIGGNILESFGRRAEEVSVILTGDEQIREYNARYRGMDEPTDVLSFSFNETAGEEPPIKGGQDQPKLLGDVLLSVERASVQAVEYGHSFEREISYLLVHGILHLLGYDHENEEDKKAMRAKEEEILKKFVGERP